MLHQKMTLKKVVLILILSSTLIALLLQTILFQFISKEKIREKSVSDTAGVLCNMQSELTSEINDIKKKMLAVYNETSLIDVMSEVNEKKYKEHYWDADKFVESKFDSDDELLALYLYDMNNHIISTYRYDAQNYPRDLYDSSISVNADRLLEYVESSSHSLKMSGYYNENTDTNQVRFTIKLHSYSQKNKKDIGYLVCDFSSKRFEDILVKYISSEGIYFF